jgi:hypothetical protein
MMNVDKAGRDDGGGDEPLGEPGWDGGRLRDASWISASAVTAFATTYRSADVESTKDDGRHTIGFPSPMRSLRVSINPYSIQSSGFKSNTFATHNAAVLRT